MCTDELLDLDRRAVEAVEQGAQRPDAAVAGHLQGERVVVACGGVEERGPRTRVRRGRRTAAATWPPGTSRLSSSGVPSAISRPWSSSAIRSASWSASSRYCVVRKTVTPPATRSRMICHMPRRLRGSRPVVGSSRKMIAGVADQGHRQVEPAPHAAGVGHGRLLGGVGQVELRRAARRSAGGPRARSRWRRSAIRARFSSPVSRPSTAENWPVTPIASRTASGSRRQVVARDADVAGVGADQRGQDLDDGGLAGAVGAEQREDRAPGDGQVDAVEDELVAVRLAQPGGRDRGMGGWTWPFSSSSWGQVRRMMMSPT